MATKLRSLSKITARSPTTPRWLMDVIDSLKIHGWPAAIWRRASGVTRTAIRFSLTVGNWSSTDIRSGYADVALNSLRSEAWWISSSARPTFWRCCSRRVSPLTLEDIVNQLSNQYPAGHAAMRGAFERDKSLLRDVGVPIETEVLGGTRAGQTAYRVDRDRYELRDLDLTDDERRALQVAVAAARTTEAEFGMFKLGGVADSVGLHHRRTFRNSNCCLHCARPSRRERRVDFRYHSRRSHVAAVRAAAARGLLVRDRPRRGSRRGAHVSRRSDRRHGRRSGEGDEFERPADFDPRAVFPSDPKELGDGDQVAIVRIDQARATFAERELGAESVVRRLPGGDVDVEVPCANLDAFRSWLFGWGVHAEVVGPADVRDGRSSGCGRWRAGRDHPSSSRTPPLGRAAAPAAGDVAVADGARRGAGGRDGGAVRAQRGRVDRRPRARRAVRTAAVHRRDDRRVHRRGCGVRRPAAAVHQAVAADGAGGLRPADVGAGSDATARCRSRRSPRPSARQAGRRARRRWCGRRCAAAPGDC